MKFFTEYLSLEVLYLPYKQCKRFGGGLGGGLFVGDSLRQRRHASGTGRWDGRLGHNGIFEAIRNFLRPSFYSIVAFIHSFIHSWVATL